MTILERLRGDARSIDIGQIAKDLRDDLREDLPVIRHDALEAVERVLDAASKAVESAADDAGNAAEKSPIGDIADAAGDAVTRAGKAASRTGDSIGQSIARAGRELRLEGRIDDVIKRIRRDMPPERFTSLVAALERELPTTDRDRYDRAFTRGWTRARTSFVGVGLLAGVAAGIAGAFLLDPERGKQRREAIGSKARSVGSDGARLVKEKTTAIRNAASERGLLKGDSEAPALDGDSAGIGAPAGSLVGVMDSSSGDAPVVPFTDDAVTDLAATGSERMTDEGGLADEPIEVKNA